MVEKSLKITEFKASYDTMFIEKSGDKVHFYIKNTIESTNG
jgi:hypothetical protein